jgi:hypothetical protein
MLWHINLQEHARHLLIGPSVQTFAAKADSVKTKCGISNKNAKFNNEHLSKLNTW